MPPCAMRSSTGLRPGNGHRLGSPTIRPTRSSPIGALTLTSGIRLCFCARCLPPGTAVGLSFVYIVLLLDNEPRAVTVALRIDTGTIARLSFGAPTVAQQRPRFQPSGWNAGSTPDHVSPGPALRFGGPAPDAPPLLVYPCERAAFRPNGASGADSGGDTFSSDPDSLALLFLREEHGGVGEPTESTQLPLPTVDDRAEARWSAR